MLAVSAISFGVRLPDPDFVEFIEQIDRRSFDHLDTVRRVGVDGAEVIRLRQRPALGCENTAEETVEPAQHVGAFRRRQFGGEKADHPPARLSLGMAGAGVDQRLETSL